MENLLNILVAVLPPFLLLGLGAFARAVGWLRAEADASLSMLTIRILYPCFILFHILDHQEVIIDESTLQTIVSGFLAIVFGFILSWLVSQMMGIEKNVVKTFRFCSGIFNYGFIAIPVALAFFDSEIVVHIIIFNLGVEVAIWTVGILILTADKFSLKGLVNPPAIAVLLALVVQSLGGKELIPSFGWEVVEVVGMCSIPMGLMLIGGSFFQLLKGFRFSSGFKVEISAILVRNLIFPCLILAFVKWVALPLAMEWISKVLIIQASMPAGIFAVVIVGNYTGDRDTAMRSIIVTMIVGLLSLPLWLYAGLNLLD